MNNRAVFLIVSLIFVLCAESLAVAQSDVRELVSGERVRVKKISRDIESAIQQMNQGGVAPFQNPDYVQKWQHSLQRFKTALQKYPQVKDPDVQTARNKYSEMANMVAFGISQAKVQKSQLGDVQGKLKRIEQALMLHPPPKLMHAPFTQQQANHWVAKAMATQQASNQAINTISSFASTANLPNNPGTVQQGAPYDKQDLHRLSNLATRNQSTLSETMVQIKNNLLAQFEQQNHALEYYRGMQPNNEKYRVNAFLKEGADVEVYENLDRELAFANSAKAWQSALNNPISPAVTARIKEIEDIRTRYGKQRKAAIGASRLPDAQSHDSAMLTTASNLLANPKYHYGEHGPIIITTPRIVNREKTISETEFNDIEFSLNGDVTLLGTETTWRYHWEEFKFATPIKEPSSGKWYIWWITAKNFSSGSAVTPIGTWVSGKATKGSEILRENFE